MRLADISQDTLDKLVSIALIVFVLLYITRLGA